MENFVKAESEVDKNESEDPGFKDLAELQADNEVLRIAHQELLNQLAEVENGAVFDSLTGLKRRAVFEEEVKSFLNFVRPDDNEDERGSGFSIGAVSLVVFDIDHFKSVNDTYGHNFGDVVLKAVAEVIGHYTRKSDISCRWGGEEMAVALIGASEENARVKADLIRQKISEIEFDTDFRVTASAGVATSSRENFKDFANLFGSADAALYESKHSGRNRVTAFSALSS